jgi:hypothetical protein
MLYINTEKAIRTLRSELKPTVEKIPKAVSMAINDTMRQTHTAAKRAVTDRYNIFSAAIQRKQLYKIKFSNPTTQTATMDVANKQIPIIAFKGVRQDAKETRVSKEGTSVFSRLKNKGKKTGGVNVQIIKGRKTHIRSAFIATMKNGHTGVFARGEYGKPFEFRKGRTRATGNDNPIQELNTLNTPNAFLNRAVKAKIEAKANDAFQRRITHHLKRILEG